jgi:hypothetical protein
MDRWLLVGVLFADGQSAKQIASQLDTTAAAVGWHVKVAKRVMLASGVGSKLDLRAALVADGHLS